MKLRPYPAYKESGLPWLGRVPKHWECLPHRAIFEEVKEQGHVDEPLLSVTISRGIIRQEDLLAESSKKDSSNIDKSKYKLVEPGDIAYNKMRAWQGAVGASKYRGIVSPAYIVQRLRGKLRPEYFHYLFRTPGFAKEAERWSYGITSDQWSLRPQHFKMIYSCLPPLDEKELIVGFLSGLDRHVRRFIRNRQRLIKVLNEQKQAIINRAVTRGLDPDAPLKTSGIDWLGDIPGHWKVLKIGHFARVGNGSTPSRGNIAYWNHNDFPWLNSSTVNQGNITESKQFVTALALKECHLPRVEPGSVLIAITGQGKTRGTAAVLKMDATINQHVAYITSRSRCVSVNPDFLRAFLAAAYPELRRISDDSGGTKGALTCGDLRQFKVVIPPAMEQDSIVASIEKDTREVEAALGTAQQEINLIREYRTRLISDVVTGKVDVRHLAPPPGSEDLEETVESLEPLEEGIADAVIDDEERVNGPD